MKRFLPTSQRSILVFAHDVVMTFVAFVVAMYLRVGEDFIYYSLDLRLTSASAMTIIAAAVFLFSGLYRGVWRYASLNDLLGIVRAVTIATLIFILIIFLWQRLTELPRSVPFINWFILITLLGGPRFIYRLLKDRRFDFTLRTTATPLIPVLLVGAEDGAELFIRDMARAADANYEVVGIIAERESRVGRQIHNVEVLGTIDNIEAIVDDLKSRGISPQRLVLTKDDIQGTTVRDLLERASDLGMTMARLPRLTDFKSGFDDKIDVRPVDVEDLLGRPQKVLDREAMGQLIKGRRILVTGAGGSIGSELVRQICSFEPDLIILLDYGEFNLYTIDMEVAEHWPHLRHEAVLADVRDQHQIEQIFSDAKPELVFHAAALKHVPLVEANPFEGFMTNVIGTANIARACRDNGVAAMVQISTDKAVNPSSIMGATKRMAEAYCQALDISLEQPSATRYITVRFGNVLGSTGSVVPLFQKQLQNGGPLTVTDENMTRYFMTVREAVELVLEASALGYGDHAHQGKIFVLDMGEPVRIIDLARQMIRLAGLTPDEDIKIDIIGQRPGEKLFEDMFHEQEQLVPTRYQGILLAAPRTVDLADIDRVLSTIKATGKRHDQGQLTALIQKIVPEYQPTQ
ncbi:MAG: polysaccharide biosynthesis protein [Rhodospirillales bacterium]